MAEEERRKAITIVRDEPGPEATVYANGLYAWVGPDEISYDFVLAGRTREVDDQRYVDSPVVVRVKIPVRIADEVIAWTRTAMAEHERAFGPIGMTEPRRAS